MEQPKWQTYIFSQCSTFAYMWYPLQKRSFGVPFDLRLNGWVNSRDSGDFRRHRTHNDTTVMIWSLHFHVIHTVMLLLPICLVLWSYIYPQFRFECLTCKDLIVGWNKLGITCRILKLGLAGRMAEQDNIWKNFMEHDQFLIKFKHFPRNWPFVRGNHPSPTDSPENKPVTRSCDAFLHMYLNKRLSKHWRWWWFETPKQSLWRDDNLAFRHLLRIYRNGHYMIRRRIPGFVFCSAMISHLRLFHFSCEFGTLQITSSLIIHH